MKRTITILQVIVVVLTLGIWLASCTSGNIEPDPGTTPTLLSGVVVITGGPLVDLADPGNISSQDVDKWSVRVIDPTESLDSIELDHNDTAILPTEVLPLSEYLLQIELLPAVDLSGGTASATPVTLALAVPVAEGVATFVDVNIELVPPTALSTSHLTAQTTGYRLLIDHTVSGTQTTRSLIEMNWNSRQLRQDVNLNGHFDDEVYFTDSDRNGISDNRQQGIWSNMGSGQFVQLSGTVEAISSGLSSITVDGQVLLVHEMTVITSTADMLITLDDIVVGQGVNVSGRKGKHGNLYATMIRVTTD